jgi:glycosyltransferase involved in cell wall biosynthesis
MHRAAARDASQVGEDEIFRIRRLFASEQGRVFMLAARLEPPHPLEGWLTVLSGLRAGDRLLLHMTWEGTLAYFHGCRTFFEALGIPPRHVWILGNTTEEVELARQAGLRAAWIHHNCWLDETLLKPLPVPKVYGAVMVCRPVRAKRPWLAAEVDDLAIVEGPDRQGSEVDLQQIPHVRWFRHVPPILMPRILSRAEVGLILSEVEGGCNASSEYLMCGLPVVSTPSRGGRDVFYDADNAVIVEPTPSAVAEGVRQLRARRLDPHAISARHLSRSLAFRQRFVTHVLGPILAELGLGIDAAELLQGLFKHKMAEYRTRDGAARLVREGRV